MLIVSQLESFVSVIRMSSGRETHSLAMCRAVIFPQMEHMVVSSLGGERIHREREQSKFRREASRPVSLS